MTVKDINKRTIEMREGRRKGKREKEIKGIYGKEMKQIRKDGNEKK